MSTKAPYIELSDGVKVPAIAYGIGSKWSRAKKATPDETSDLLVENIVKALKKGFVHLDMAETYNTYPEVKEAFNILEKDPNHNLNRDDLFIVDKYWTGLGSEYMPKTKSPKESLEKALDFLGLEYVDLYLIHSPFLEKEHHGLSTKEAWKEIEEIYKSGKAKSIGVSNFDVESLKELLSYAEIKPTLNQIEYNAYLQNQTPEIIKFCKDNGIVVSAYSPLAPLYNKSNDPEINSQPGPIDSIVEELSGKYAKTNTQILLRWVYQTGVLPVTTSQNEERMDQMLNIWDFELSQDEVALISKLGQQHFFRKTWEPFRKYDLELRLSQGLTV